MFIGQRNGSVVYLVLYVDDGILLAQDDEALDEMLSIIKKEFVITTSPVNTFVGMEIERLEDDSIFIHQRGFISSLLNKFNMQDCKPVATPMQGNLDLSPAEQCSMDFPYRQLIGSLLFLARSTRPDIAYAVAKLARYSTCHDEMHWIALKRILRYLKGTMPYGLLYTPHGTIEIVAFSDCDFAGDKEDRKSTSGVAIFIHDSLIVWMSKKQKCVAQSTTEAEFDAGSSATKFIIWLRTFLPELGFPQLAPTKINMDNTSAIKIAKNPELHDRVKHMGVRLHLMQDHTKKKDIELSYISTDEQTADVLTKPLLRVKFQYFREKLGMRLMSPLNAINACASMLTYMLALLCLCAPAAGVNHNSIPILWRKSDTPVTGGYLNAKVIIRFVNPCSLLTADIVHGDLVEDAIKNCNDIYMSDFLQEIESMCPRKGWTEILESHHHVIVKRFIPLLVLGGVIVFHGVIAGLAISATVISSKNADKIEGLKLQQDIQQKAINELGERVNMNTEMIRNLQYRFNLTIKNLIIHQKDFDELKDKTVSTNFAISYITSRLTTGKSIIKEAQRQWKHGNVYGPFLDYFNLTLPCGDSCPTKFAKTGKCELSEEKDKIFLDLTIPIINQSMILLEADPFKMMLRKGNQTCAVKYNGPNFVVLSLKDSCVHTVNVRDASKHDLIYAPYGDCTNHNGQSEQSKYFIVDDCVDSYPHDQNNFVQVKAHHEQYHIYCPESSIEIDGRTQPCPSSVFSVPINTNFRINSINFVASQITLDTKESWDPLLTMKTNWQLNPSINWGELGFGEHDMTTLEMFKPLETRSNYNFWASTISIGFAALILLLVIALAYKFWTKDTVTVTALPIQMRDIQGNAIEQETNPMITN